MTTARAVVVIIGLAALVGVGFGGRAAWRKWEARSKSASSTQDSVRGYLKKHASPKDFKSGYDFNLRAGVSLMQTNAARLRDEAITLRTNLAQAQKELGALLKESTDAGERQRVAKRVTATVAELLADREKRLSVRALELGTAKSNLTTITTNVAVLQDTVTQLETHSTTASNEFALAQTALTNEPALNNQTARATARGAAAVKQQEFASIDRRLSTARQSLAIAQKRFETLNNGSALAETNLFLVQTNVTALRAEALEKQDALVKITEQATARQAALAAKQSQVRSLRGTLTESEDAATKARRDLVSKEQSLANQHAAFAREIRTNITAAPSYEAIYTWIGRALWTSDRLLENDDLPDQRSGAMLAEDAANYAIQNAENPWLAARICEGWVWPNLEKYDAPGKPKVALNQVLQTCANAFTRAGETNNLVKNFQLRLQHAPNPRAADGVRYYLANLLEQSGSNSEALELYRTIQDTNLLGYAQRRIAVVEKRIQKP